MSVLALGKEKQPMLCSVWLQVKENLVFGPMGPSVHCHQAPNPHLGCSPWGCCAALTSRVIPKLPSGRRCQGG